MKRILIVNLISVLMLVSFFCRIADAKYSGGSGTSADPYQIATAADLFALAADTNDYNKSFILVADINLDPGLPGRQIFTTAVIARDINNANTIFDGIAFSGQFDGDGHTIRNLRINTVENDCLGLFGDVNNGIVKNLNAENFSFNDFNSYYSGCIVGLNYGEVNKCTATGNFTGGIYTGLLVGYNTPIGIIRNSRSSGFISTNIIAGLLNGQNAGTIENCSSSGDLTSISKAPDLGGLVGRNISSIKYCSADCNIDVIGYSSYVGGLVGWNWGGLIQESFASGKINTGQYTSCIGGLAGWNQPNALIINCYATTDVNCDANCMEIGGLVGFNGYGSSTGYIVNCYSIGNVIVGAGTVLYGACIGYQYGGYDSGCYYLNTSGYNNGLTTPLTDSQLRNIADFNNWDFNDTWRICNSAYYPKLRWQFSPADFVCPDGVNFTDFSFLASHWNNINVDRLDVNTNGVVDFNDFAVLASRWDQTNCGDCNGVDFSGDGNVDFYDLVDFCAGWLASNSENPSDTYMVDLNNDGKIDYEDLIIFTDEWLQNN